MTGLSDHRFAITTSVMDCTGCTLCVGICLGKKGQKALAMARLEGEKPRQVYFDYGRELTPKPAVMQKFGADTVKGSQFRQPLLEFSGACAGCGETPMPSSSPSCLVRACISPMPPAAPPSGVARPRHPLYQE